MRFRAAAQRPRRRQRRWVWACCGKKVLELRVGLHGFEKGVDVGLCNWIGRQRNGVRDREGRMERRSHRGGGGSPARERSARRKQGEEHIVRGRMRDVKSRHGSRIFCDGFVELGYVDVVRAAVTVDGEPRIGVALGVEAECLRF